MILITLRLNDQLVVPGNLCERGQLNDKGSCDIFFFKTNNQCGKTSRLTRDCTSHDKTSKISKYSRILNLILNRTNGKNIKTKLIFF
jgi:hypothetical protein